MDPEDSRDPQDKAENLGISKNTSTYHGVRVYRWL